MKALFRTTCLSLFSLMALVQTTNANTILSDTGRHIRLLVLCTEPGVDRTFAVKAENKIVISLVEEGYSAYAGTDFVLSCCIESDTLYAVKSVQERGFTAILSIKLLDKLKNQYRPDGKQHDSMLHDLTGSWQKYYHVVKENDQAAYVYNECKRYAWEYNFYEVPDGRILFSGRSRSFRYDNRVDVFEQFANLIKKEIIEKQVMQKEQR